jgi:amidase
MLRRNFIKTGSLASLAITTVLASACNTSAPPVEQPADEATTKTDGTDNFELNEVTIATLQDKMKSGTYTSRSICEM